MKISWPGGARGFRGRGDQRREGLTTILCRKCCSGKSSMGSYFPVVGGHPSPRTEALAAASAIFVFDCLTVAARASGHGNSRSRAGSRTGYPDPIVSAAIIARTVERTKRDEVAIPKN